MVLAASVENSDATIADVAPIVRLIAERLEEGRRGLNGC
jgi:hypothetical protein